MQTFTNRQSWTPLSAEHYRGGYVFQKRVPKRGADLDGRVCEEIERGLIKFK